MFLDGHSDPDYFREGLEQHGADTHQSRHHATGGKEYGWELG